MSWVSPEDAPVARRRRPHRLTLLFVVLPLAAFGGVTLALWVGFSPVRLRPVAGFLGIAAMESTYFWVALRMTHRRAKRLRSAQVPWRVRLAKPFWISLIQVSMMLVPGAVLGAVAAILGFPSFGLGALLTFAALAAWVPFAEFGMSPRGLTFEPGGLRIHIRGATFLVPWPTITKVERIGPDHSQMIRLHLKDSIGVIRAAQPDDPRARARVETFIGEGSGPDGQLILTPWTAGLDGPTLARTIGAAMVGEMGKVN
jgi:hypothetical protein